MMNSPISHNTKFRFYMTAFHTWTQAALCVAEGKKYYTVDTVRCLCYFVHLLYKYIYIQ